MPIRTGSLGPVDDLSCEAARIAGETGTGTDASLYQFLVAVNAWYNHKIANILSMFAIAKECFGNRALDHTVVPYLTEVEDPSQSRGPKASLICGGKALVMKGGQFLNLDGNVQPQLFARLG